MKCNKKIWQSVKAAGILLLVIFAPWAFAQTAVKLFDETLVLPSPGDMFGTKSLVLECGENPKGTISSTSDGAGSFVVDDILRVDGVNVCTGCFNSYNRDFSSGAHALNVYTPVPSLDISESLAKGKHLVTFELVDAGAAGYGQIYASSDIWLVTNCAVPPQVAICHKPGTSAQKTLSVQQSAVSGHLGHGDTLGECTP